jgi:hypothetical protein
MRTRHLPLFVGALAVALALGGCGGKSNHDGVATAGGKATSSAKAASKEDARDKMRKFAACMREHGVDMPDPKVAEGGSDQGGTVFEIPEGGDGAPAADPQKIEAAQKACGSLLPDGGDMPKPDAATVEQMRRFAKCMRENGIDKFPDPDDNGMTKLDPDSGFNPRDPKFQEAQKKCEQYAPKPPSGGPGGAVGGVGAVPGGGGGGK